MRYLIVILFCIHAPIHLIGVAKQAEWVEVPASGASTFRRPSALSSRMGALWLAACASLMIAAWLLMQGNDRWWSIALGGVLLSQFLVVLNWPAAKAGT